MLKGVGHYHSVSVQVLTWLLEAEEELSLMDHVDATDLKTVRKQFRDFEQFMASLTDSQDTVGRVLARLVCICNCKHHQWL